MAALCAIALLLIGTLHQASAGRQVLQAFTSLPAVGGTATWAPAASYSSSHLVTPLPSGPPTNSPFGAMTNIFAASTISSGSISDSGMRTAAPTTSSVEAVQTMFDTTKRYIGSEGPQIQGLGIVTAVGAGNAPGAMYATQQRSNGHSSLALPMGQELPAFPNTPTKPPTLIMNEFPQQHQGQIPQLPVLAPTLLNSGAPSQVPQWSNQLPQLSLHPMPQLGSLSQLPQPQLPQSLIDIPGQMQRFAQAATEGNLVKAIEDVGDFVRNSISNVTAAADSIITATNGVIASLPKNFTISGELGKLINSSVDMTANVLKSLPKPDSVGQAAPPPSMARLGGFQQAGNMLSQLSLPRLPGLDNLQFPRLSGMNIAAAGQSGPYSSPISVASATANTAQQYSSDTAQFWAEEKPEWVTKAMGGTTASTAGSTTGSTLAGNSMQPSRATQKHISAAAGAVADSVGPAGLSPLQSKNVVVAVPRGRAGAKRAAADPWAGGVDSATAVSSTNMQTIPATTVPLPGIDISVSDAAAAAAAAAVAVAAAPVVAEPRVRAGLGKAPSRKAGTGAPAAPVPAAAPETEELVAAAAPSKSTAASTATPAAATAVAPEQQAPVVAAAAVSSKPAAAEAAAAAEVEENKAVSNSGITAVAAPAAAAVERVTAGPAVTSPAAAALTSTGSNSSSSADASKAPITADTTAAAVTVAPAVSPTDSSAVVGTSTAAASTLSSSSKTMVASSDKPASKQI